MLSNQPLKLIYIVGTGHSGSTLLDLLLGSHSSIESDGEICAFADYFASTSDLTPKQKTCTCGLHVDDCEYWQQVNQKLDLGSSYQDLDINTKNQQDFEAKNFQLLSTILEVSGKTVFCDSSKQFKRLNRYLESDLFALTIVHLIRDGRAVGYSKQKKTAKKTDSSEGADKPKNAYFQSLKEWQENNGKIYQDLSSHPGYICLKYEDLVANPRAKLTQILAKVDLQFEQQQLEFWQTPCHNLSGNRWRKRVTPGTPYPIQRDVSYLKNIPLHQWWMSNIKAFSTLRTFGYPLIRESIVV